RRCVLGVQTAQLVRTQVRENDLGCGTLKEGASLTAGEEICRAVIRQSFTNTENRAAEQSAKERRVPGFCHQFLHDRAPCDVQGIALSDLPVEFDDSRTEYVVAVRDWSDQPNIR